MAGFSGVLQESGVGIIVISFLWLCAWRGCSRWLCSGRTSLIFRRFVDLEPLWQATHGGTDANALCDLANLCEPILGPHVQGVRCNRILPSAISPLISPLPGPGLVTSVSLCTRAVSLCTMGPLHLVVLQHGLWGQPENLGFLEGLLTQAVATKDVPVVSASHTAPAPHRQGHQVHAGAPAGAHLMLLVRSNPSPQPATTSTYSCNLPPNKSA